MMAACAAAQQGAEVVLLEKNEKREEDGSADPSSHPHQKSEKEILDEMQKLGM